MSKQISILITSDPKSDNQYLTNATARIEQNHSDFSISYDFPFEKITFNKTYRLLHIQWIEELFDNWKIPSKTDIDHIITKLKSFKKSGTKIVWTLHNHKAHHHEAAFEEIYKYLKNHADGIIHLGKFSREFCRHEIPDAIPQLIIPHPNYRINLFQENVLARKKLGIDPAQKLILVFGAIRKQAEKERILCLCQQMKNIQVIVPRWQMNDMSFSARILEKMKIAGYHQLKTRNRWVPDTQTSLYFAAADVVLIPRGKVMNSGNLILAFNYAKTVIGPNFGNIGQILKATQNFCFDPSDKTTVANAVLKALSSDYIEIGLRNKRYADQHWSSGRIAEKHAIFYREMLASNNS